MAQKVMELVPEEKVAASAGLGGAVRAAGALHSGAAGGVGSCNRSLARPSYRVVTSAA